MRKNLLVILTLVVIGSFTMVCAKRGSGAGLSSVGATITGFVELQAGTGRNFPEDLLDIYIGNGDSLTLGLKGKSIKIRGEYNPEEDQDFVVVTEDINVDPSTPKYMFLIPVPRKVAGIEASGLFTVRNTAAVLGYLSEDELNQTSSTSKTFKNKFVKAKKLKSPSKQFRAKLRKLAMNDFLARKTSFASSYGELVTVRKVSVIRKGNKGILSGEFERFGTPARGRFVLNMTFDK